MTEFEYNGMWWLPENPDHKVSGVLKFHPLKGINLELIGSFKKLIENFGEFIQPNIILGITSTGKLITLYKCREAQSTMSMPGFITSSFDAKVAFQGYHFEREEDIIFNSFLVNYSNLEEWAEIVGFQIKFKYENDPHNRFKEIEVRYSHPKKVEASLGKFNVFIDFEFKFGRDRISEVNLKQITFIKIELHNPIHFDDYQQDICYHIQNFLSLAMGKAIYPLIVKGKFEKRDPTTTKKQTEYDVLIFYPINSSLSSSKIVHPHEMLFSFKDILDVFEKSLKNWFSKSNVLKPVYDLYFGTLYNSSMYLQHEFLSLVQALESYHRRRFDGKYLSDEEYNHIYKTLINAIPQEVNRGFKDSAKGKLKHLHEFSLRKRLKDILKRLKLVADLIVSDEEEFIDDVVNTRNFLTHYDSDLEKKAKKGKELYILTQKIKSILEACFLMELEIPTKTVRTLVLRSQKYRMFAS